MKIFSIYYDGQTRRGALAAHTVPPTFYSYEDNPHHKTQSCVRPRRVPNGNGRYAREMADLLIERMGGEAFTRASGSLQIPGRGGRNMLTWSKPHT
jgi:hypothetical protein